MKIKTVYLGKIPYVKVTADRSVLRELDSQCLSCQGVRFIIEQMKSLSLEGLERMFGFRSHLVTDKSIDRAINETEFSKDKMKDLYNQYIQTLKTHNKLGRHIYG